MANEKTIFSFDNLKKFLGVFDNKPKEKIFKNNTRVNIYSPMEANNLIIDKYIANPVTRPIGRNDLISYLHPIYEKIAKQKLNSEQLRALSPEINKAGSLFATCIMSPVDLQDGEILFDLDLPEEILPESVKSKIVDLLTSYFNETLELGIKETEWINEILFTTGSKPILILPDNTIRDIKNREEYEKEVYLGKNLQLSTNSRVLSQNKNKVHVESINSNIEKTPWMLADENIKFSVNGFTTSAFESFNSLSSTAFFKDNFGFNYDINYKQLLNTVQLQDTFHNPYTGELYTVDHNKKKFDLNSFTADYQNVTVKILKELGDGDFIKVTDNPEVIRAGHEMKTKNKDNIQKRYDTKMTNKQDNYLYEETVFIPFRDSDSELIGHPLFQELPSEAVIPVTVPGDVSKHIGYFILLDEYGYPIRADEDLLKSKCCEPGSVNAAYQSLFGKGRSCFGRSNDLHSSMGHVIASRIFEDILKEYLNFKTESLQFGSIEIDKMNSISACMFYRLMFQKKTMLLFVPEHYLVYMAYDYNSDGTGKSKIQDIEFILSLKHSFMIASILSMMNAAVPRTRFNVNFPNDPVGEVNPERLMDQIKSMYVENNKMSFSSCPSEIVSAIYNNSVTVVPNNLPGAEGFSVEKSQDEKSPPIDINSDFFEKLENITNNGLIIPPSVLNKLSEDEFARSILTNNLFLTKETKAYQRRTIPFNNKIVRTYTRYSPILREHIANILKNGGKDIFGKGLNIEAQIDIIINNISTSLAPPNIAADKAQFQEIREYIDRLQEILDIVFSNEIFLSSSEKAQNAITIIKANIKRELTLKFLSSIGANAVFDIPEISDLNSEDVNTEYRKAINYITDLTKEFDRIEGEETEDDSMGGGDSFDSFGSDTDMEDSGMDDTEFSMNDTTIDEPPLEDNFEEESMDESNESEDFTETGGEEPL